MIYVISRRAGRPRLGPDRPRFLFWLSLVFSVVWCAQSAPLTYSRSDVACGVGKVVFPIAGLALLVDVWYPWLCGQCG